ncbi:MAG TPA: hypothetical protein VFD70_11620 [Anaerolineae bacterium]|nr:hypothetical protein [Anaerolineae bacterium]
METRQCVVCKEYKAIDDFNFRHRFNGERHTHCRDCQRIYKRRFYLKHREEYIQKSAEQVQTKAQRNRQLITEYLLTHPCVDCGESDVVVLEFDHVGGKERLISKMVRAGVAWERVLAEIEKCEVRCGNCHKKKTAREHGWFKFLGL